MTVALSLGVSGAPAANDANSPSPFHRRSRSYRSASLPTCSEGQTGHQVATASTNGLFFLAKQVKRKDCWRVLSRYR